MGGCCIGDCCVFDCGFCCIFDSCSDHGCSYHPREKITVDHSKVIADELAEMKEKARKDGQEIGEEAFNQISGNMGQFILELTKINQNTYGGKKLNIKIDAIKRRIDELRNEVKAFVGDRLDERLVLTDAELSVILEERDDAKRKKNFDAFYQRIHKQAIGDLSKKIEDVIVQMFALVDVEIRNRLKEVEKSMSDALADYNKFLEQRKQRGTTLASDQVNCMYGIAVADIMLDELNSAAK